MLKSTDIQEKLQKMREEAEEREAKTRAANAKLPYLNLNTAPVQIEALKMIPKERAFKLNVASFKYKNPDLALAVVDPNIVGLKELIQELEQEGSKIKLFVGSMRGVKRIWQSYQYVYDEASKITGRIDIRTDQIERLMQELKTFETAHKAILEFDSKNRPVSEFFEVYLAAALANRTSDIHFEPEKEGVKLRYRVDGLLHDIATGLSEDLYKSVLNRVKLLSNLKLNVRDRPQDGRFTIGLGGKEVEMRIAIAPSEYGEIIVMRILDPDSISLTLEQLGIRKDDLEIVYREIQRPNGMILNTGPTGSGKTTTLYAFMRYRIDEETKIITVEDPIEYHVRGLEQTQVDEEAGYTFGSGLRSMMRQDPDIILVGEIRDQETAEIAVQAALTGHLVFSTVHANEAAGAIPRFLDLNVKPASIGPAVSLIMGQRLVRRLCKDCKSPRAVDESFNSIVQKFLTSLPSRVDRSDYQTITLFNPSEKGCNTCNGIGFKGRVGVYELFVIGDQVETIIQEKSGSVTVIREYARQQQMVTMQEAGILKVFTGDTTFDEVESATGILPKEFQEYSAIQQSASKPGGGSAAFLTSETKKSIQQSEDLQNKKSA
ncbi:MAG: hypothetical protein COU08_01025 [Candidatus Harrisonbacteria bacterium CG10_big_fil_rev_8_21_14_0_10_42_17]|uniref:Bacterial type II secretion system protein E domain-containing protein n=1 Tax=Candidatus Harrisonbacteria bacterium CG10_big_fil_rev_8_21_14_0_10_42_17 TaxID=1974584 RepID=A0A2M6WIV6_9BACT|nr:MAG: hypothetical protein COU08_01025 [Candidatus Harrisonbacteria bacterium CG10_big_fil_rev_8_21_14_0_10_42_17]